MKKILYLTFRMPFPAFSGERIRSSNFISYLNKHYEITIISFYDTANELSEMQKYAKSYKRFIPIKRNKLTSFFYAFFSLIKGEPLQIGYFFSLKYKKAISQELKFNNYDIIFSHIVRTAQYIPKNTNIKKIVDLTDALSLNYKRTSTILTGFRRLLYKLESHRMLKYELETINKADKTILISQEDAEYLTTNLNQDKIVIIPNGVDFIKYGFSEKTEVRQKLVFVGTMSYIPNIDAVNYFVKEIYPLIKKEIPNIKFCIVGAKPADEIIRLHNNKDIIVTGFVESTIPYFKDADVFIAPFRIASGLQNKIIESLAVGTPVVTTPFGAEGLDKNYLHVASDSMMFAEFVVQLINQRQLNNKYSIMGRQYVETYFNWDNNLKKLDKYF